MPVKEIGQNAADFASKKIGSWFFIITFNTALALYIGINVYLGRLAWDPYPFILLNLALSWLAGVQAPLIMISQNRQQEIQDKIMEDNQAVIRATYEVASAIKDILIDQKSSCADADTCSKFKVIDKCVVQTTTISPKI